MSDILLEAVELKKHFLSSKRLFHSNQTIKAVDGVSFRVRRGETFAIVGESGCGKSTLARVLMRLLEPTSGDIVFDGRNITETTKRDLSRLRKDMQFIFQDPYSSLNPRLTVSRLVGEPIEAHFPGLSRAEYSRRVRELLEHVGLQPSHANLYPHEFSGGQRQRIGIARALAVEPKLLIGDEPVSALDVSVQAQIINQLEHLKSKFNLTLLIIAHDLAVIRHMSDRVAVIYLGKIMEVGTVEQVFNRPRHPYTASLLSAIPEPIYGHSRPRLSLRGETPSPIAPPSGCRFHTRCPFAKSTCSSEEPLLRDLEREHSAACHFSEDLASTFDEIAQTKEPQENYVKTKRIKLFSNAVATPTL